MDLELNFEFNDDGIVGFKIFNPPSIPNQGEVISVRWEDFITDSRSLEIINEIEANDVFRADIFTRRYTKSCVYVRLIAYREKDYYEVLDDQEQERRRLLAGK